MLSWFDASEAKDFGIMLAHQLMEKMPQDAPRMKEKLVARKHEALINKMSLEIVRFKEAHSLNIFKKAKLGNAFKWTLKEAGYDSAYVDHWTNWLMLQI